MAWYVSELIGTSNLRASNHIISGVVLSNTENDDKKDIIFHDYPSYHEMIDSLGFEPVGLFRQSSFKSDKFDFKLYENIEFKCAVDKRRYSIAEHCMNSKFPIFFVPYFDFDFNLCTLPRIIKYLILSDYDIVVNNMLQIGVGIRTYVYNIIDMKKFDLWLNKYLVLG